MLEGALAGLVAQGWRVVDDLVIGPPGVVVVAGRSWPSPVTITLDGRLVRERADHTGDLRAIATRVEEVTSRLGRDGVTTPVRGVLVLEGGADRALTPREVGGVVVGGVEHAEAMVGHGRVSLARGLIDAVATSFAAPPAPGAPSAMFEEVHRFFYLAPWSRGGRRRMYLNDRHGTGLGFTDLTTGAVELTCGDEDRRIAETLLAAVETTGITVTPGEVPRMPTRLFGGRLLSRLASRHASLLVGHEWRAYGKHRMYGTLLDPKVTTFDLGWVDLATGERHPSAHGPAVGDQEAPEVYLQYLLHHRPRR